MEDPLYKVVDENTRVLYELKPKDVQHLVSQSVSHTLQHSKTLILLVMYGSSDERGEGPEVSPYRYVSERSLVEV